MQGVGVVGSGNGTFNQAIGVTASRRLAGDSAGMVSDLRSSVSFGFSNGSLKEVEISQWKAPWEDLFLLKCDAEFDVLLNGRKT